MNKVTIAGVEINKVSFTELLFNKTMLLAYVLLAMAVYGIYEAYGVRYFSHAATAHASGLDPTNPALIEAMKIAIFGQVGEISREMPWTLYIVNYMYMVYTGSGIIFLVALAEILNVKIVAKVSAGFLTIGIAMVFAGLFTIGMDLNMLNILSMFTSANYSAGMWLMLPLYMIYIPLVLFEIYLVLNNKREFARKIAYPLLIISIIGDFIEYYIQAKLFSMNTARHLWTQFPFLTLYFILSSFVAALGVMGIFSAIVHRKRPAEYQRIMQYIRKTLLALVLLLGIYEVIAYMSVDVNWVNVILFGELKYIYFFGYILLALAIPFFLSLKKNNSNFILIASFSAMIGCFFGRYIFVYGGNSNPLSNRFGTGFEQYDFYAIASSFNYFAPHIGEVLIVIGSLGVVIAIYNFFDTLFGVSEFRISH